MAEHTSNTPAPIGATLVPTSLLDRAVSLQSTAAYIEALLEVVGDAARRLREGVNRGTSPILTSVTDWRQIEVLLNLASEQTAIVLDVARALERAELHQVTRATA